MVRPRLNLPVTSLIQINVFEVQFDAGQPAIELLQNALVSRGHNNSMIVLDIMHSNSLHAVKQVAQPTVGLLAIPSGQLAV